MASCLLLTTYCAVLTTLLLDILHLLDDVEVGGTGTAHVDDHLVRVGVRVRIGVRVRVRVRVNVRVGVRVGVGVRVSVRNPKAYAYRYMVLLMHWQYAPASRARSVRSSGSCWASWR